MLCIRGRCPFHPDRGVNYALLVSWSLTHVTWIKWSPDGGVKYSRAAEFDISGVWNNTSWTILRSNFDADYVQMANPLWWRSGHSGSSCRTNIYFKAVVIIKHEILMRWKWHFTQKCRLFWKLSTWPLFLQCFHHLLPLGRLIPFSVLAKSLMLKQGFLFLCLCSTKSFFFFKKRKRDVYAKKINHSGTLFLLTFEVVVFWGWMLKKLPSSRFAVWRNGRQHDCFLLNFCFLNQWQPNCCIFMWVVVIS